MKPYFFLIISVVFNLVLAGLAANFFLSRSELESNLAQQTNQIQQLNAELGLAEASLTEQKTLTSQYKQEIAGFPDQLKQLLKTHRLELSSRDATIARLKSTINGGTTVVVETPATPDQPKQISYDWRDSDSRFHLADPDIFVQGNETFEANQMLSLKGWVFADEEGHLQIKKIEISEVKLAGKDSAGKPRYEAVQGSTTDLVESHFEYTIREGKISIFDVIKPKLYASYDSSATPGLGVELVNFGQLAPFANFGIGAEINPDLSDPLAGSLAGSRLGANLTYRLLKPLFDSNLGIAAGLSTPVNDFGGRFELTADAIFYLTN